MVYGGFTKGRLDGGASFNRHAPEPGPSSPNVFTRLRTRLTVLYVALFGATLLVVSVSIYAAINQAAQRQVRGELTATGTVFDRVWSLRSDRLREGAALHTELAALVATMDNWQLSRQAPLAAELERIEKFQVGWAVPDFSERWFLGAGFQGEVGGRGVQGSVLPAVV